MCKPIFKKVMTLGAIILTIPFFMGCIHLFHLDDEAHVLRTPSGNFSSGKDYSSTPEDLSLAELKQILAKNSFSKIEQLLEYLKTKKPNFMNRYTLVYNSKSLHGSSKTNPRAIVYGKSADFVITFNGSPDQKAYEMLEVMSFNKEAKTYDFFEIEFNENNNPLKAKYQISESGGPNQKCLACHVQGKPIWETYRHWPGVIGSGDDFPLFTGNQNISLASYVPGLENKITSEWEKFKTDSLTQGRYRFLLPQAPSISDGPKSEPRPNLDLGLALHYHNMERMTELLKNSIPPGPEVRSLILYSYFCYPVHHVPEALQPMYTDFYTKANATLLERNIYLVKEEVQNLGTSWQDLQRGLQNPNSDYYRVAAFSAQDEKAFYKEVAGNTTFSSQNLVHPAPFLFSVLEKFVPKAHVESWPMNIHRAYHFDNGRALNVDFDRMIIRAVYPDKDTSTDKKLLSVINDVVYNNFDQSCGNLLRTAGY